MTKYRIYVLSARAIMRNAKKNASGNYTYYLNEEATKKCIGNSAFYQCSSLKDIIIPYNVTSIESQTFDGCTSLTNVIIPDHVTQISIYAFLNCSNLKTVLIPENVTSIGYRAFYDCPKVKIYGKEGSTAQSYAGSNSIQFVPLLDYGETGECTWTLGKDGTLTIKGNGEMDGSYDGHNYIAPWINDVKAAVIEPGVTNISSCAFSHCPQLSSVSIPDTVTEIDADAFIHSYNLKSITIPGSVNSIGDGAFYYCSGLESVELGNGVESIESYAFLDCANLASITIPASVTYIGQDAFAGCSEDFVIKGETGSEAQLYAEANDIPFVSLDNIIARGTTGYCIWKLDNEGTLTISGNGKMGDYSSSRPNLTSITIPESVTNIEYRAIYECPNVTIYGKKSSAAESFARSNGIPFVELNPAPTSGTTGNCTWTLDKNGTLTISGNGAMGNYDHFNPTPWGYDVKKVVINNGVTKIGDWAFAECSQLTDVTIPNSVTQIGYGAFRSCSSLSDVEIPNSVTSIGDYAFCETGLVNVDIPNSVTSIGECAFWGCPELENVNLGNGLTSIGDWAFADCEKLTSVVILENVTSIGDGAFEGCFDDFVIKGKAGSEAQRYAAEEGYRFIALQLGDLNLDGAVDIMDVTVIQKYAVGRIELSDVQLSVGDVNGDGSVDVLDATKIQKYCVGLIDKFA